MSKTEGERLRIEQAIQAERRAAEQYAVRIAASQPALIRLRPACLPADGYCHQQGGPINTHGLHTHVFTRSVAGRDVVHVMRAPGADPLRMKAGGRGQANGPGAIHVHACGME